MSKKTQRARAIYRNRLDAQLRRAGLPEFAELSHLLRQAAGGDDQAAAKLDTVFPEWRKTTGDTRVSVGGNGE